MAQEATPTDATPDPESDASTGQAPNTNTPDTSESTPPAQSGQAFGEDYVKGLRKEAASARTRAASAEKALTELRDRDKTEGEKLAERVAESERRASAAEAQLLRYEVARDRKLPARAVSVLTGATREEIEASADALAELIETEKASAVPSFDGGTRQTPDAKKSPEQAHNELLLRAFGRQP